jgi:hypothetical protein
MYRLFFLTGMLFLFSCKKHNAEKSAVLKAIPAATTTARFIMLDAAQSTGDIASWKWQIDSTDRQYPLSDSLVWWTDRAYQSKPDKIVQVIVPRFGRYVFGLTVYDKNGDWDYSVVNVDVK